MKFKACLFMAALSPIYLASILKGQAAAPEFALAGLRDSLAALSDTAALRRLLKQRRPADLLQSGYIALRLGDILTSAKP